MRLEDVNATLLDRLPEFYPSFERIQALFGEDNGKIGEHVVFGELFEFCLEQCRTVLSEPDAKTQAVGILLRLLAFVEDTAGSPDSTVRGLVAVSFLEYLPRALPEENRLIRSLLGRRSRHILRLVESES